MNLKIGNSVKVKHGVKDPDSINFEIGGWQGRVIEIEKETDNMGNTLITIEWDSLTLAQLPAKFIHQSNTDKLDWKTINLYESDLDKTVSRDKKSEVKKVQKLLAKQYYWTTLGESGLRISNILAGLNPSDEMKSFQRWNEILENELSFPIQAIVAESEDNWLIKTGDKLQIKSLSEIVDLYGIIAKIKLNGKTLEYPLCNLMVLDKESTNYQMINDYGVWFANR
jgi:hypothetical protein